jgi:hypothetical protein
VIETEFRLAVCRVGGMQKNHGQLASVAGAGAREY